MAWHWKSYKLLHATIMAYFSHTYICFTRPQWVITHWIQVMHIFVSNLTIIGSDNGLSPGRRQVIIWTDAGTLLIGPLGTNFSEIWIQILTFSFKKMRLKVSSAKWRPFCLGLNVLKPPRHLLYPSHYHCQINHHHCQLKYASAVWNAYWLVIWTPHSKYTAAHSSAYF